MSLTKEATATEFQKLVDASFNLNSLFDNVAYALEKELKMPKLAGFIHHIMAHSFPVDFADTIQEFALSRGVRITRGQVDAHTKIYSSPIDAMQDCYDALVGYEMLLDYAINVCIEDGSKPAEDFLRNLSANLLPNYIFQIEQFLEGLKAADYDNVVTLFNLTFKTFIIPYFKDAWLKDNGIGDND